MRKHVLENRTHTIGSWCVRHLLVAWVSLIVCTGSSQSFAAELVTPEEMNNVRVYKKMSKATVLIASAYVSSHHIAQGRGKGIGSGVLIDEGGSIVTNAHVIVDAAKIMVTLHDGLRLPADLVGMDLETDLALLHVALPKGKYPHAKLGDSDKLEVGQKVIAIGHPFGLAFALSSGVISGFGKLLETHQEVFQDQIIQTTTPINPGNSGGPLVDSEDRVIGINTAILMGAENIAFAIPINAVKSVVTALQTHGRVIRPWLGVKGKFVTEDLRNLIALPLANGLLIVDIDDGSPAEKVGLQAGALSVVIEEEPWVLGGDIIVAINGQDVKTAEQYKKALQQLQAKQTIVLTVFRGGESYSVSVKLEERPTQPYSKPQPKTEVPPLVPQAFPPAGF
jgi:S1-C subfamily serine protease